MLTPQGAGMSQGYEFTCQQSGLCCRDPNLIVTLTYRDLYLLFVALDQEFHSLIQRITFNTLEDILDETIRERLVLRPIQTTRGLVIPGLRKSPEGECILYVKPNCGIYQYRPLACSQFPFAFRENEDTKALIAVWTKNAKKICPGIGQGSLISEKEINEIGERYFEEVRKHNDLVENLNLEASQGNPLTVREAVSVSIAYAQAEFQKERE